MSDLTRRELFALVAMHGILSGKPTIDAENDDQAEDALAGSAIAIADKLITKLDKNP